MRFLAIFTTKLFALCFSPSEGPCCSESCQLIPYYQNKTCREATACKDAAICEYPLNEAISTYFYYCNLKRV